MLSQVRQIDKYTPPPKKRPERKQITPQKKTMKQQQNPHPNQTENIKKKAQPKPLQTNKTTSFRLHLKILILENKPLPLRAHAVFSSLAKSEHLTF